MCPANGPTWRQQNSRIFCTLAPSILQVLLSIALASGVLLGYLLLPIPSLYAQQAARIEEFSPQGTVKNVRQVRARFSQPMVPLGLPGESVAPFVIDCPEKGTARWADGRNWIYDFDHDLGAGVRCEFRVREGLKTLAGTTVGEQLVFTFSTGGPSILSSVPYQGSDFVDEEQIFVLELDGQPAEASVLAHVYFAVEGLKERIGIRVVSGEERERVLKTQGQYARRENVPRSLVLIQAKRRFPQRSKVTLVWGKEVASQSGVTNTQDQILPFKTRSPFLVTFNCSREKTRTRLCTHCAYEDQFLRPGCLERSPKNSSERPGRPALAG